MKQIVSEFFRNESGTTAIEYALIAAGISIAILVGVNGIGGGVNSMFQKVKDGFS